MNPVYWIGVIPPYLNIFSLKLYRIKFSYECWIYKRGTNTHLLRVRAVVFYEIPEWDDREVKTSVSNGLKFLPGDRLTWLIVLMVFLSSPRHMPIMTASLYILSNSLFTNHPILPYYIMTSLESVFKGTKTIGDKYILERKASFWLRHSDRDRVAGCLAMKFDGRWLRGEWPSCFTSC